MTVKAWTYARKYVGSSADTKPLTTSSETIPVGSEFFESDTGLSFRYDGYGWALATPASMEVTSRLDTIIDELRLLRELHTNIAAKL